MYNRKWREVCYISGQTSGPLPTVTVTYLQVHQFPLLASEDLSHLEGLGQEPHDLASSGHSQFVIFRQFIHTKNGYDILEGAVVLGRGEGGGWEGKGDREKRLKTRSGTMGAIKYGVVGLGHY